MTAPYFCRKFNFSLKMLAKNIKIKVFKIPYVFLQLHSCELREKILFPSRFKFASVTLRAAKRLKFNKLPENGSSVAIFTIYEYISFFFEQLKTWLITSLNNITQKYNKNILWVFMQQINFVVPTKNFDMSIKFWLLKQNVWLR